MTAVLDTKVRRRCGVLIYVAILLAWIAGCALTNEVPTVRTADDPLVQRKASVVAAVAPRSPIVVQLRRVSSSLPARLRFDSEGSSRGSLESSGLRWADSPETYIQRELGRTLTAEGWGRHAPRGLVHLLDVNVVTIDILRQVSGRAIRVQVRAKCHRDRRLVFDDTLTIESPVLGDPALPEDLILALAFALDTLAGQLTTKLRHALVL